MGNSPFIPAKNPLIFSYLFPCKSALHERQIITIEPRQLRNSVGWQWNLNAIPKDLLTLIRHLIANFIIHNNKCKFTLIFLQGKRMEEQIQDTWYTVVSHYTPQPENAIQVIAP